MKTYTIHGYFLFISDISTNVSKTRNNHKVDKADPRSRYHYVKYVKRHGRTVKLWECGICKKFLLIFFSSPYYILLIIYANDIFKTFISFTLYPAHSRVGRGNLVLRHSIPPFLPNFGGIACWVAQLNAALCLDTRTKKWKDNIISFSRTGIEPTTSRFTVTFCAPAPRLA